MDADAPLLVFKAQCLQCVDVDFLAWPPRPLLAQPDARYWLLKHLFTASAAARLPPASYRATVLASLFVKLRRAGVKVDAKDDLCPSVAALHVRLDQLRDQHDDEKYITYTLPGTLDTVTLVESRDLVSGSRFTGHRTWDGALHLASYLLTNPNSVAGRSVLELGAGAGFLSVLCAKHLGAARVVSTDGDARVLDECRGNMRFNGLNESSTSAELLLWGQAVPNSWADASQSQNPEGRLVLGADLIYNEEAVVALVETLHMLLDSRPRPKVLLSWASRFPTVSDRFYTTCESKGLAIIDVPFDMTPPSKQKGLFYSTAVPLRIVEIKRAE